MSFLEPLLGAIGAGAGAAGGAGAAASALGHSINVEPLRIREIADKVGNGMNQIAVAGGAAPGYAAPQGQPAAPVMPMNNHLQMLDTGSLDDLIRKFGAGQYRVEQYR